MLSKINVSFDLPIGNLGELLQALSELLGINIGDVALREKAQPKDMGVAEFIPPEKRSPRVARTVPLLSGPTKRRQKANSIRFILGNPQLVDVPAKGKYVRKFRYTKMQIVKSAKSLKDIPAKPPRGFDTVIVATDHRSIKKMFEDGGQAATEWVRLDAKKAARIKHLALYETQEFGGRRAIVALAPVVSVERQD